MWLVLVAGAAIGFSMAQDPFLHLWDERFHALVAKRLLAHPLRPMLLVDPLAPPATGFDWTHAHAWLHKPPLSGWTMASGMLVFGRNEVAVRLPSLAFMLLGAYAVYRIGLRLFDRDTGLVASALAATNGMLLALATGRAQTDHPDSLLTSLSALALWAALEAHPLAFGALVGLAFLAKSLPALLLLVAYALWKRQLPDVLFATLGCGAVALPWTLWTRHAFPAEARAELYYSLLHLHVPLEGHTGGPFFHLAHLPLIFGAAAPLAIAWFAWTRRSALLLIWAAVPYAAFSLAATKMPAYPLSAAPAIFVILGCACVTLLRALPALKHRWLAVAALAVLIGFPLGETLHRWRPMAVRDRHAITAAEVRATAASLPPGAILYGYPHSIELMFYSDRLADDRPRAVGQALPYHGKENAGAPP